MLSETNMAYEQAATRTLKLGGKPCYVTIAGRAREAMRNLSQPLYIQMELYFSCLIRLKVRFYDEAPEGEQVVLGENVYVSFRPVMTAHCSNDDLDTEPPVTDFPIMSNSPFIPRWLHIDYRHHQWQGEFGYANR